MKKPSLYKKIPLKDAYNRNHQSVSPEQKQQANAIVKRFVELFKEKYM